MQEQIDRYILGKMADDEREVFEQELADSAELQAEVDLHRDIIHAIRMKGAKDQLKKVECDIRAKRHRNRVFAIRISGITVAACLALGIFLHFDTASDYRQYGDSIMLTNTTSRSGDSMSDVVKAIEDGNYDDALRLIEVKVNTPFDFYDPNPEIMEYARLEYNKEQEDLLWYKAVIYMRMGKYFKARELLKEIAASDSYYKADAQKALDEI